MVDLKVQRSAYVMDETRVGSLDEPKAVHLDDNLAIVKEKK